MRRESTDPENRRDTLAAESLRGRTKGCLYNRRTHVVGLAVVSEMAAGSEEDGTGRQQITNWETPGNLAATNPLG